MKIKHLGEPIPAPADIPAEIPVVEMPTVMESASIPGMEGQTIGGESLTLVDSSGETVNNSGPTIPGNA
jgi:hypothetical protein